MDLYDVAQELASQFTDPILIGGVAAVESGFTEVTTNDIDAIVMVTDRGRARQILSDYSEHPNHGGNKGRGKYGGLHVDVYFEYESVLGIEAQLSVQHLVKYRGDRIGNWYVLTPPAQFVTKLAALLDRAGTSKGYKDAQVLYGMVESGVSAHEARNILIECSKNPDSRKLWEQAGEHLRDAVDTSAQRELVRRFFRV